MEAICFEGVLFKVLFQRQITRVILYFYNLNKTCIIEGFYFF